MFLAISLLAMISVVAPAQSPGPLLLEVPTVSRDSSKETMSRYNCFR